MASLYIDPPHCHSTCVFVDAIKDLEMAEEKFPLISWRPWRPWQNRYISPINFTAKEPIFYVYGKRANFLRLRQKSQLF
jgi:hypothetical protein